MLPILSYGASIFCGIKRARGSHLALLAGSARKVVPVLNRELMYICNRSVMLSSGKTGWEYNIVCNGYACRRAAASWAFRDFKRNKSDDQPSQKVGGFVYTLPFSLRRYSDRSNVYLID